MTPSARRRTRLRIQLNFLAYPVQSTLGVLGRKWALLILMNIAIGKAERFNELLRSAPGMSKRILAMRLRELERNGFIACVEQRRGLVRWQLAPKGQDVLPVLLTLIHFASKWRPEAEPGSGAAPSLGSAFEVVVHRGAPPVRTERAPEERRGAR